MGEGEIKGKVSLLDLDSDVEVLEGERKCSK